MFFKNIWNGKSSSSPDGSTSTKMATSSCSSSRKDSSTSSSTPSTKAQPTSPTPTMSYDIKGQEPSESDMLLKSHHDNSSTSNLSTTSTLIEGEDEAHTQRERESQQALRRRMVLEHAWKVAEQRRRANASASAPWPQDPWRGGFGPPPSARRYQQ